MKRSIRRRKCKKKNNQKTKKNKTTQANKCSGRIVKGQCNQPTNLRPRPHIEVHTPKRKNEKNNKNKKKKNKNKKRQNTRPDIDGQDPPFKISQFLGLKKNMYLFQFLCTVALKRVQNQNMIFFFILVKFGRKKIKNAFFVFAKNSYLCCVSGLVSATT